ncbi:diguanylate cyclase domain-containing protein [Maridesulfovibrio sp. FT414]|uniref:diguanylate cyclase domain-containing protein n=1 Tax=Maridesulfovibrio sp. FT414 TaxID=2979469 RepID=UPI003D800E6E
MDELQNNNPEEKQKRLEDELEACRLELSRNSNAVDFLNGLLDQSLVGIYVIEDGRFSYVNKSFALIFGYDSPAEIVGRFPITELVAPECRDLVSGNVQKRQSGKRDEMRYTFTGLRKDGSRNIVEVHGRSMLIGDSRKVIGVILDMTNYERMSHLAYHDPLTGLPNRALFMDRLEQAVAQARRGKDAFAVMYIDLDGFKEVNDSVGHAGGDTVLRDTAKRMVDLVRRDADSVSRIGGDEFVVLLRSSGNREYCAGLAADLIEKLERPITCFGESVSVGVSIGISIFPDDGDDPERILQAADCAMFEAKKEGKHTFAFAGVTCR